MAGRDYKLSYPSLEEAKKDQRKPQKTMSGKKGRVQINPADSSSLESRKDRMSKESFRSGREPLASLGSHVLRNPYDFTPPGKYYDSDCPSESIADMPYDEKDPDESIDCISVAMSSSLKLGDSPKLPKNVAVCEKILILENSGLKSEISNLKALAENCTQEMALHLKRLEQCLKKQTLENKGEINSILADLKRTTNLLKGDDEQSVTVSQMIERDESQKQDEQERGRPLKDVYERVPPSVSSMSIVTEDYEDCQSTL